MQPLLNKPGLEATGEDQRFADFICALRERQRCYFELGWTKLEPFLATGTILGKAQERRNGPGSPAKAGMRASKSKGGDPAVCL